MAAMQCCLAASTLIPTEIDYLKSIDSLARGFSWIEWSSLVTEKRDILVRLNQKASALDRLPEVQKKLQHAEQELVEAQQRRGLFSGLRISELQSRLEGYKREALQLKQAVAYEPPEPTN